MISDSPIIAETQPLPVRATILAAVRMLQNEWREILKIILVPILILSVIVMFVRGDGGAEKGQITAMVHGLISLFLQPLLAVALLRYLFLGEKNNGWIPNYHPRIWSYMWRQCIVGFATFFPVFVISIILFIAVPRPFSVVLATLAGVVVVIAATRLSLVLPASALGDNNSLKYSWQRLKGQIARIMLVRIALALLALLPVIGLIILSVILGEIFKPAAFLISFCGVTLLQVAVMQIADAAIYAHFREVRPVSGSYSA